MIACSDCGCISLSIEPEPPGCGHSGAGCHGSAVSNAGPATAARGSVVRRRRCQISFRGGKWRRLRPSENRARRVTEGLTEQIALEAHL
jgi:hypothetical protein